MKSCLITAELNWLRRLVNMLSQWQSWILEFEPWQNVLVVTKFTKQFFSHLWYKPSGISRQLNQITRPRAVILITPLFNRYPKHFHHLQNSSFNERQWNVLQTFITARLPGFPGPPNFKTQRGNQPFPVVVVVIYGYRRRSGILTLFLIKKPRPQGVL